MSIEQNNILNSFYAKPEKITMTKRKGIYLYDSNGKKYIDCASATFNMSLGYSNEEVIEAAKSQMNDLIHITSSYISKPILDLTEKLREILPKELNKIHLKIPGGSEANEGAIKMAQVATGKKEVASFYYSHLGQTIFTMNASGNSFRSSPFNISIAGIIKIPAPYCYRCFYNQNPKTCGMLCAEKIHDILKFGSSNNVAALVIEPIFGNGDNIVPPDGYLNAIRKICDEYKIALVFDEIQTGLGRTGSFFASQYYNVVPDFMSIAKGLGGTGFQVAAIACKEEYTKMNPMHHSFTYGSNLMAASAGSKTIEIMQRPGFLSNVIEVGHFILKQLKGLSEIFSFIGEVRGVGLMIGFEIVKDNKEPDIDKVKKIQSKAFENGLILRSSRY